MWGSKPPPKRKTLDTLDTLAHFRHFLHLSSENIVAALDQIEATFLRVAISKEIEKGCAHYKESALIEQMLNELSDIKAKRAGITNKQEAEMSVSDPTAIKALITQGFSLKEIPEKLRLLIISLSLYYWGVPLSRLGQWLGCHKTTVLRNLIGLVLSLWPMVERWIINLTKGSIVYIDEKWLKIKGKWHYYMIEY